MHLQALQLMHQGCRKPDMLQPACRGGAARTKGCYSSSGMFMLYNGGQVSAPAEILYFCLQGYRPHRLTSPQHDIPAARNRSPAAGVTGSLLNQATMQTAFSPP